MSTLIRMRLTMYYSKVLYIRSRGMQRTTNRVANCDCFHQGFVISFYNLFSIFSLSKCKVGYNLQQVQTVLFFIVILKEKMGLGRHSWLLSFLRVTSYNIVMSSIYPPPPPLTLQGRHFVHSMFPAIDNRALCLRQHLYC